MSNVRAILISAAALAAVSLPGAAAPPASSEYVAYVGTYTRPNRSKGIYAYKFDAKTGKFTSIGVAAETPSPSFVIVHPNGKFVFAANEANPPTVSSFAIEPGTYTLKPLNSVNSKGSGPCHVALDRTGKWLFVANYNSGSAASFPINADGTLGEAASVVQHAGSSVNPQRQRGPHAHEVVVSADNKFVFVPDLGLDKVMIYKFDPAKGTLTANDPDSAKIAPGSGPRHLAFTPNNKFMYLMTEMTSSVVGFSYDAKKGSFTEMQTYPAVPADFAGQKSGAEIAVHPNGKFVYASNRNHNSITVFSIDAKGALKQVANVLVPGKTPRHFAIDPTGAFMTVENQDTNNIVVFKIDQKTGALTPTGDVLEVSQPVAVAFLPVK